MKFSRAEQEHDIAHWRADAFGVPVAQVLRDQLEVDPAWARYYSGHGGNPYLGTSAREKLPPASDRSWIRGTWAPVPITWLPDRWTDLWIECKAAAERERMIGAWAKRVWDQR